MGSVATRRSNTNAEERRVTERRSARSSLPVSSGAFHPLSSPIRAGATAIRTGSRTRAPGSPAGPATTLVSRRRTPRRRTWTELEATHRDNFAVEWPPPKLHVVAIPSECGDSGGESHTPHTHTGRSLPRRSHRIRGTHTLIRLFGAHLAPCLRLQRDVRITLIHIYSG